MPTVSDFIIDRLIEWDLHRFYGFPGDGIGGFDGVLERAERGGKDFRYIRSPVFALCRASKAAAVAHP